MTIGFEDYFKGTIWQPLKIKVNIVTLEPYCGRGLRIQPNKSVDEEKEFKYINSCYRKKNSDKDQK